MIIKQKQVILCKVTESIYTYLIKKKKKLIWYDII